MRRIEVEVLTEAVNAAVVRLPGRSFPAAVVPGDSLAILVGLARSVRDRVRNAGDGELVGAASELHDLLAARLRAYESALEAHGVPLPHSRPCRGDD
jgi:hypothetical protein